MAPVASRLQGDGVYFFRLQIWEKPCPNVCANRFSRSYQGGLRFFLPVVYVRFRRWSKHP